MLIILFGSTVDMGKKSRDYFVSRGFELIQKYNYVPDEFILQERFGKRLRCDKEQVQQCNFVYENNGMLVGFNKDQIIDAVRGRKKCILTASSGTIDFVKQIKAAYGEYVTVIGTYIDEKTLKGLFEALPDVTQEEVDRRVEKGMQIKRLLLEDRKVFDHIVIYGGEDTTFNFDALTTQYEFIIERAEKKERELNDKMYVEMPYSGQGDYIFVSYSHKDDELVFPILRKLQLAGCRIWYDEGIEVGENWRQILATKIQSEHCKDFLLFSTVHSTQSKHVQAEIHAALNCDKKIITVSMDDSVFPLGIQMYLQTDQILGVYDPNFHDKLLRAIDPSVKLSHT